MKINKIRDYNQIMLSVFGSLATLLILIILLYTITEYTHSLYRYDYSPAEMVSNEKAAENYDNSIRTHQVSFENLILVDTVNKIYLMPVAQSLLEHSEYIEREKEAVGLIGGGYSGYRSRHNHNSYNNALIYDAKTGNIEKIFDFRVSINSLSIEIISGNPYVFLSVINTNRKSDDLIDYNDTKSLFIYDIKRKKLSKINSENTDFIEYEIVQDTDKIIIKYGLDKNENNTYNWDEPKIMKMYSISDNKLIDIVPSELVSELQNTLDGKK